MRFNLSPPDNRARNRVRGRNGIVDVNRKAGIARGYVSWDGDFGRAATSSPSDLDLGARDVELRRPSDMETNLLDANEVFAGGRALRDSSRNLVLAFNLELEWVKCGSELSNLEPVRATAVPRGGGAPGGHLAKVYRCWALVVDCVVEDKSNARSSSDSHRLSGRAGRYVAGDIARGNGLYGRVVEWLTDCRLGLGSPGDKRRPNVVSRNGLGSSSDTSEGKKELHIANGLAVAAEYGLHSRLLYISKITTSEKHWMIERRLSPTWSLGVEFEDVRSHGFVFKRWGDVILGPQKG